jgi:hypothetical protein
MAVTIDDFMQMMPIFIAVFMVLTTAFNGDVKAFIWLLFIFLGVGLLRPISSLFRDDTCTIKKPYVINELANYPNLSVSTFIIIFTLFYLMLPMKSNNDWNYFVIAGFLGMFAIDMLFKVKYMCTTWRGIFSGATLGAGYAIGCYYILHQNGGDKFLYFNTVSSNNVYCSRPKKQQFKCNVYKGGEIISTL